VSLPTPIVTAILGAIVGAIFGGLIADAATRRRDQRARCIALVGEIAKFYGRCEAALIHFQRQRVEDSSVALSEGSITVLAELSEREGEGHQLYWDVREAFRAKAITEAMWELTRRVSHTKQMLTFIESPRAEFAEGISWINYQCRVVIQLCGDHVGLAVEKDTVPFFLGMGVIDDAKYASRDAPWEEILLKKTHDMAERMWAERRAPKTPGEEGHSA